MNLRKYSKIDGEDMDEITLNKNIKTYIASKQKHTAQQKYKVGDDVLVDNTSGEIIEVKEEGLEYFYKVKTPTSAEVWYPEGKIVKVDLASYQATKQKKIAVSYDELYDKMLTPSVKEHIFKSIEAAIYDGHDEVYIESERIVSAFQDTLSTEEYHNFDFNSAVEWLEEYAGHEFEKVKKETSTYQASKLSIKLPEYQTPEEWSNTLSEVLPDDKTEILLTYWEGDENAFVFPESYRQYLDNANLKYKEITAKKCTASVDDDLINDINAYYNEGYARDEIIEIIFTNPKYYNYFVNELKMDEYEFRDRIKDMIKNW